MICYFYDMDRRRWGVAHWLGGEGADRRDLDVYHTPGRAPELRENATPFHPQRGGWSDAQPSDPRIDALLAGLPEEAFEAPALEPAKVPTVPAPAPSDALDPSVLTVDELEDALEDLAKAHEDDVDALLLELAAIRVAELDGKGRKTAVEAIDALVNELQADAGEEE